MQTKRRSTDLNCSLARALTLVGDAWSLLIVRDAFLGATRFGQFQASLGLAKNILSDRLMRLVDAGILDRTTEGRPSYRLTERGRALLPAMAALMQWGDAHCSGNAPPMLLSDSEGKPVLPVALATTEGPVAADAIRFYPGPGADDRARAFLGARQAASATT